MYHVQTMRGSAWRGRDCNDLEPSHHPGARYAHRFILNILLDFLRPIRTAEAFEAVDWLTDLPQRTWLQACHQ